MVAGSPFVGAHNQYQGCVLNSVCSKYGLTIYLYFWMMGVGTRPCFDLGAYCLCSCYTMNMHIFTEVLHLKWPVGPRVSLLLHGCATSNGSHDLDKSWYHLKILEIPFEKWCSFRRSCDVLSIKIYSVFLVPFHCGNLTSCEVRVVDTPSPWETVHGQSRGCPVLVSSAALPSPESWLMSQVALGSLTVSLLAPRGNSGKCLHFFLGQCPTNIV